MGVVFAAAFMAYGVFGWYYIGVLIVIHHALYGSWLS